MLQRTLRSAHTTFQRRLFAVVNINDDGTFSSFMEKHKQENKVWTPPTRPVIGLIDCLLELVALKHFFLSVSCSGLVGHLVWTVQANCAGVRAHLQWQSWRGVLQSRRGRLSGECDCGQNWGHAHVSVLQERSAFVSVCRRRYRWFSLVFAFFTCDPTTSLFYWFVRFMLWYSQTSARWTWHCKNTNNYIVFFHKYVQSSWTESGFHNVRWNGQ